MGGGRPLKWREELGIRFPTTLMQYLPDFGDLLVRKEEEGDEEQVEIKEFFPDWPERMFKLWKDVTAISLQQRMENLQKASCWLDFYSMDPDCSPYEAIFRNLRRSRVEVDE